MNELYNILMQDNVKESINNNIELLLSIIPELNKIINLEHNHPHHHLDVWNHTLYALSLSEKDFEVRLALLLHDIGKKDAMKEDENGIRHFPNHPAISASISNEVLTRLNCDEELKSRLIYFINRHDYPISKKEIIDNYELSSKLIQIQECDALAHHPDKLDKRKKYIKETKGLLKI